MGSPALMTGPEPPKPLGSSGQSGWGRGSIDGRRKPGCQPRRTRVDPRNTPREQRWGARLRPCTPEADVGSQFGRSQFMIDWCHPFGPVVRQHMVAGLVPHGPLNGRGAKLLIPRPRSDHWRPQSSPRAQPSASQKSLPGLGSPPPWGPRL